MRDIKLNKRYKVSGVLKNFFLGNCKLIMKYLQKKYVSFDQSKLC